jgi:hypothetical protein
MGIALMTQPRLVPLELNLLTNTLNTEFNSLIIGIGTDETLKQRNFRSKAVAAYVLLHKAGATAQQAAQASIDGGLDHGIDSVFISSDNTLWLVQSKYIELGRGEPELGDIAKFRDGVTDLIHGKFERFNQQLNTKAPEIQRALSQDECRVRVVLAYSGTAISDDRRHIFGDLERAFNGTNPAFLQCFIYGLSSLHDIQLVTHSAAPIESIIELNDYGYVPSPYRAFYGRISAKQLAELGALYGDALVERNIRRFKGSSDVNDGINATLIDESHHFFYFNNGVTFLCESISEIHPRDTNRQKGRFRARGISIINGAQTVGAIAKLSATHYENYPAEVLATFVCLESAPDTFGDRVTQYRNRQNAVDLQDFAALDEKQSSWRQTLLMAGVEYIFKHGDGDLPASSSLFSVQEAAVALACSQRGGDWCDFIMAVKTDRKRLFRKPAFVGDTALLSDAYLRLFTDSLTARDLWRSVQISRIVQKTMKARANGETGEDKEILQQGIWLTLHILFIKTQLQIGEALNLTSQEESRLSIAIDTIANQLVLSTKSQQWGKQIRSVFENKTDSQKVKSLMMPMLTQTL